MEASGSSEDGGSATETTTIRVVLVDDHAIVRSGLRRVLADHDGIEVVGEAGDAPGAIEQVDIKRPDIVVLDLALGDVDALEHMPELLRKARGGRVLVLSMYDDVEHVQAALAAGAHGYLLKDAAEQELVDALTAINAGDQYIQSSLGARLVRASMAGPSDPLTDREREVARLLALGHTNQEIAKSIYVSVRTVETHRAHVMGKLGLHSRAELVQWALDQRLIG
jgi:DNA-binding NarL/FixJ family response regulator